MQSFSLLLIMSILIQNLSRGMSRRTLTPALVRPFSRWPRHVFGEGPVVNPASQRRQVVTSRTGATTMAFVPGGCRRLTSSFRSTENNDDNKNADDSSFFANNVDFASVGVVSNVLRERLAHVLGPDARPTLVQHETFATLRSSTSNVTIGAETGSGKTLAYLLPLMDDIIERKEKALQDGVVGDIGYDYARAVVLVPNKELVQQVVRMALPLAGGPKALIYGGSTLEDPSLLGSSTNKQSSADDSAPPPPEHMVRLGIFPGGLEDPMDFPPFRNTLALGGKDSPVDLVIATPAALGPLGLKPKYIEMFADIPTLVIDESDMLLDGGYIRALENVLLGFRRADRLEASLGVAKTQHVFVAATLPDYGLRSVDAYLQKRFPDTIRVTLSGMHQARHSGLAEQTLWISEESKQERMKQLVEQLGKPTSQGGLQGEKVMVFLNSVDDVEGASQALLRAGHNALPYHAKMRLQERTATLDRFRRYTKHDGGISVNPDDDTVGILVCSDLAARGIDVPNVDAVVQLQFASNVVAHLHRMGRCGRAGQRTGRGIVFFDSALEGALAKVVQEAEAQQDRMVLEGAEVLEVDAEGEEVAKGSVKKAFSRKRGFTKKLKKMRREAGEQ